MTNKHDYEEKDEDDDEDDGLTKEDRKRRIKNKSKFKKHRINGPEKIGGFIQKKPRNHNWQELMDEDEDEDYGET